MMTPTPPRAHSSFRVSGFTQIYRDVSMMIPKIEGNSMKESLDVLMPNAVGSLLYNQET